MAATFLNQAPQPGDGEWSMQNGRNRRVRRRRNVQSFLLQTADNRSQAKDEVEVGVKAEQESFLRPTCAIGKERVSQAQEHEPRTIRSEKPLSRTTQTSPPPPLPAPRRCQRTPTNNSNTDRPQDSSAPSTSNMSSDRMVIPPHLRPRKVQSTSHTSPEPPACDPTEVSMSRTKPTAVDTAANNGSGLLTPPPTAGVDIRTKLQDLGVHVSEPKTAQSAKSSLIPHAGSNKDEDRVANYAASQLDAQTTKADSKTNHPQSSMGDRVQGRYSDRESSARGRGNRGRGRGRGRGHNAGTPSVLLPPKTAEPAPARRPRVSRWPKNSEMRPYPRHHDTMWDEPGTHRSRTAGAGWGDRKGSKRKDIGTGNAPADWGDRVFGELKDIDSETGFKLTGWDGDWAPAPVDWDARPAFRDNQSAAQIMSWMDVIEESLVGVTRGVPIEELTAVTGDYGEIAPRHWIPIVIGKKAPQTFWNELMKSNEPGPTQQGDLTGAMPWWELYEANDGNILEPCKHPQIEGVEPDESRDERLARESDFGSAQHAENRKRVERAKRDAEREKWKRAQEKSRKIAKKLPAGFGREAIKPGVKLYIRSAKPADFRGICDIFNHYVQHSVSTPVIAPLTERKMELLHKEIVRNKLPFLVACKPGEMVKSKTGRETINLPEMVLGFAFADDYNDMLGMYRFTVEAEVWVHKDYYMKGIGKCLMDKLMGMLDADYIERGGYDIDDEELEGMAPSRTIQNIIINLSYDADRPARLEWFGNWLTNWIGFKQSGDLKGVGFKKEAIVNLAIFQRTTGANIDPANPPITMRYPSSCRGLL